jgi:hypothetical protein
MVGRRATHRVRGNQSVIKGSDVRVGLAWAVKLRKMKA